MLAQRFLISILCLFASYAWAEMADLTESEMSEVSGEGVGLVYENYQFDMKSESFGGDTGNSFKITGIKDGNGDDVSVEIGQYYIAGSGSNLGTSLDGNLVNIGRLTNPITIDLLDGNALGDGTDGWADKSVLSIAMPTQVDAASGYHCTDSSQGLGTGTCSSRPENFDGLGYQGERFDMGMSLNRQFIDSNKDVNLGFHAQAANMDGSYWRFWGGATDANNDGTADNGLQLEGQLNFYAESLVFNTCNLDGSSCGESLTMAGFEFELALGDAKYYQPMTIDVTDTGFLHIMIQPLPAPGDSRLPAGAIGADGLEGSSDAALWAWYNDYYTNGRKTNVSVSDVMIGSDSFGSSSIQGLQIQYLEVISHEI